LKNYKKEKIWKKFGKNLEKIWKKFGKNLEKIWKKFDIHIFFATRNF
jgi:hypothetical protein